MTASFITEKDAAAVDKKVLTELLDTDKHAPAGVIYANGVIVSTAAPLPVTSATLATQATLATIDTDTGNIATAAATIAGAVSGTEMQVDIVSGAATISGSVAFGIPVGAIKRRKTLRLTASTTHTVLWDPASGKLIALKDLLVTWQGATATRLTIWAALAADTAFGGTEQVLFDIDLDANANGGTHITLPDAYPDITDAVNFQLKVTLSANKTVFIRAIGDER